MVIIMKGADIMISSISAYTTARKGVSGMMSGLDTDEIVKGMTSSTRGKITKLLQNKQTIAWKTDAYRSISEKLISFSDKYTSFSKPATNILSDKFFNGTTVTPTGTNSKYVTVSGSSNNASSLGITSIQQVATTTSYATGNAVSDNKLTTGELDFSTAGKVVSNLAGQTINLKYGDVTYNVTFAKDFVGTTDAEVKQAFNAALDDISFNDADGNPVKLSQMVSMDVVNGKFEIKTTGSDIKIEGATGKVLDNLGLKVGASATSSTAIESETIDTSKFFKTLNFNDTLKGKSISFNLNGLTKTISFDQSINFQNIGEFQTYMQGKLNSAYGTGRVQVGVDSGKLTFEVHKSNGSGGTQIDPTSKLTMSSNDSNIMGEYSGIMGTDNNSTNKIDITKSLADIKDKNFNFGADGKGSMVINGKVFDYTKNDSIKSITDRINNSDYGIKINYMETSDNFSIVATESGAQGKIEIKDQTGNFSALMFGDNDITSGDIINKGQDAIIKIKYDGMTEQTLIRSSNTFTVDGLTITLAADAAGKVSATDPIKFSSVNNTDEIVKTIKAMVDDFNAISELVNKELGTRPNRNYAPLTDEQREGMSESQVKDWETQAKAGMLFGDTDLRMLSSELRFAFSFDVTGVSTTLKDMGISVSSSYKDNGKIIIDEEKLKAALESNPDDVRRAFTAPKDGTDGNTAGLMNRVKAITDKYAATTGLEKGKLIQVAGLKDSFTSLNSLMQKKTNDIDKSLATLKNTLKSQEDRYYKQFTSLERYISQMNAQSSWLSQQMGG